MIVLVEPGIEGVGSLLVGVPFVGVGEFVCQRLLVSLDSAVGLWAEWSGADVAVVDGFEGVCPSVMICWMRTPIWLNHWVARCMNLMAVLLTV